MTHRHIILIIVYPVLIVVGFIILLLVYTQLHDSFLRFQGYYVMITGADLSERLIEEGRKPEECRKFRNPTFALFTPSTGEHIQNCIYEYAQNINDPTVCSLLLPSEYGLACISNLWPEVSGNEACGLNQANKAIFECRDKNDVLHQSSDCKDFSNNVKQFSACIYYGVYKEKNLSKCKDIPDAAIRTLCTTEFEAWEKYPELRNSFYFGGSGT